MQSHVKSATLLSNVGAEVSFQLPNEASSSFKALLTEIDSRKAELGVNRSVAWDTVMFMEKNTDTAWTFYFRRLTFTFLFERAGLA